MSHPIGPSGSILLLLDGDRPTLGECFQIVQTCSVTLDMIVQPVLKIRLETDPHPINKSLVEIELEDTPRNGMKIPFPEHLVKDLKFIFAQNRNLLPPSLRSDEKNTFLHYKI